MFSCKFCEISKNTFFTEQLRTTASVATVMKACSFIKKRLQHRCFPVNIPEFLGQLSETIFNEESSWIDLISLFNVLIQVSTIRSTTTTAYVFLAKSADFFITKDLKQVDDDQSIWVDKRSSCGLYNWWYKDLSMSRDQKVMVLLSPMEKCPINFYHGVAFTAQIW